MNKELHFGNYIDGFRCACICHIINTDPVLAFWLQVEMGYVADVQLVSQLVWDESAVTHTGGCGPPKLMR